jgi:hypothetical protein
MLKYLWTIARKPIVASSAVVTLSISSAGVIDYNREVLISSKFAPRPTTHIGESMENLHDIASEKMLTFGVLRRKKDDTVESASLYNSAEKAKADILRDSNVTEAEAEDTVVRTYRSFAMRMARRSLIRNGHYLKWARAVVEDDFIKVIIMPTVTFIVMKFLRKN